MSNLTVHVVQSHREESEKRKGKSPESDPVCSLCITFHRFIEEIIVGEFFSPSFSIDI